MKLGHITPGVITVKFELENGIVIMAAGSVVEGAVEFYELAGVITDDNIMEIIEKFKEAFDEERQEMH